MNDKYNEFVSCLEEIKACNKTQLVSNCYFDNNILKRLFDEDNASFDYEKGAFLNLFVKHQGFYRIYYFVVDFGRYSISHSDLLVCDIFTRDGSDKQDNIQKKLLTNKFYEINTFHKWVIRNVNVSGNIIDNLSYLEKIEKNIEDIIETTFDKYSHHLPSEKGGLSNYMRDHNVVIAYENDMMVGFLIYHIERKVIVEDFWFVNPAMRGRGVASNIYMWLFRKFSDANYSFSAWVRDNNIESIALRKKFGAVKTKEKQIVYLRYTK